MIVLVFNDVEYWIVLEALFRFVCILLHGGSTILLYGEISVCTVECTSYFNKALYSFTSTVYGHADKTPGS